MNPRQDNIIINSNNQSQIEVNDKNEIDELQKDIIDKLNDKEFLQCKCSEKNGISDTLIRISAGIENTEDLIEDFKQALS